MSDPSLYALLSVRSVFSSPQVTESGAQEVEWDVDWGVEDEWAQNMNGGRDRRAWGDGTGNQTGQAQVELSRVEAKQDETCASQGYVCVGRRRAKKEMYGEGDDDDDDNDSNSNSDGDNEGDSGLGDDSGAATSN
ncbi:hypothetical protein LZ31DRAFT_544984 [Colletotrichum somersetense]|nr:hypothetical protein LZ31DRAFT_544984 [Colletotrichum somersetense]